nr:DUF1156 domain-containing protein [Archaeoglobus neptunius]
MRLLIEEFIPVEEISEEAKKEKLGRAPTFELHYWWARKPLITARAAVLGALVSKENLPKTFGNGDLKTSLLHILRIPKDISKGPRAHTQNPPAEYLKDAIIKTWGEMPTVLDPFAGGGSIPFEALRLGCNAVAVDYNPVAYLILKATLEYPKKYGMKLYYDVKKYAEQIFSELKEELGRFYPKHDRKDVAAYIFAWVVKCPQCGFETPLVGSWQLAKTKKKELYLAYEVEGDELKLEVKEGKAPEGNVSRGSGVCLKCGAHIPNEEVVRPSSLNKIGYGFWNIVLDYHEVKMPLPDCFCIHSSVSYCLLNYFVSLINFSLLKLIEKFSGEVKASNPF